MARQAQGSRHLARVLTAIVALLLIATSLYGCGTKSAAPAAGTTAPAAPKGPAEIPIGVVVGLSGAAAAWGGPVLNGVKMVVDEVNANGGIKSKGGAKIKLVVADHQSQPQTAGTETEKVISLQNVLAVIGNATSGVTMVGSEVAEKFKTPMLSTDLGESLSNRGFKYFFRIGPKTTTLSKAAVDFAGAMEKKTGKTGLKVAMLADDSAFSQDSANGVLAALKGTDFQLIDNVVYPNGKVSDFSSIVAKLQAAKVDIVFQAGFAKDGILIVQAMKTANYNPLAAIHVAGAPYTPEFAEALKQDTNYIFDAVGFVPEVVANSPSLKAIGDKYTSLNKKPIDDQSALAVQLAGVLVDALERAKSLDRESLREALTQTDLKVGQTPYIIRSDGVKFDDHGDNLRAGVLVMQIQNQQQRIVAPESLAKVQPVWPTPPWSQR